MTPVRFRSINRRLMPRGPRPRWRIVCWVFGHVGMDGWGDNGCYTIHEDELSAEPVEHFHLLSRWCWRCDKLETTLVNRDELTEPPWNLTAWWTAS